jgi:hypothetical protein
VSYAGLSIKLFSFTVNYSAILLIKISLHLLTIVKNHDVSTVISALKKEKGKRKRRELPKWVSTILNPDQN